MKEKDIIAKEFFRDNERFADIFNVGMFQGKYLLFGNQLEDAQGYSGSVIKKHRKKIPVQKNRDVIKKAVYGTNFALIGLENQSDIHYAMPVRVMGYDYLRYEGQLQEIRREHKKKKDLKGAEYISGFSAKDKVKPVFTLVLYYGKDPWLGPKSLSEMTDWEEIPEEIRRLVADYPLYVLDIRRFKDVEKLETDVRLVFGFLQRERDKNGLREYIEQNQEAFVQIEEDTYDMISAFTKTEGLIERKEEFRSQGGINMCEAIRQMIEDGKAEGKLEGKLEGQSEGKLEGLRSSILILLDGLGPIPDSVKEVITKEQEPAALTEMLKAAAKAASMEEFAKKFQ